MVSEGLAKKQGVDVSTIKTASNWLKNMAMWRETQNKSWVGGC